MDHAFDAVGDGGGIGGEEPGIEAADAAGRGDRARDQEQAGGIGQQAGVAQTASRRRRVLPVSRPCGRGKARFPRRPRGSRRSASARARDGAIFGLPLIRLASSSFGIGAATGTRLSDLSTRPPGKTNLPGMNTTLSWRLPTSTFGLSPRAIDQDQRRGVLRPAIGMVIGFFFFFLLLGDSSSFRHFHPHQISCLVG